MNDNYVLDDGASIAVIGGGPTGSFFSIFALKMAKMLDKEIRVTIYEPKDFRKDGPGGCNRCGGIISEILVQMLAVEGINLPESIVQRGINSYKLHTEHGSVQIETPTREKTIATVYRGGGPKGIIGHEKESFDNFLLNEAVKEGAAHESVRVDHIDFKGDKPQLFHKEKMLQEADLVVGAFGVNSTTPEMFEGIGIGYRKPETVIAAIGEIGLDREVLSRHFGNSINLFLLPQKDIKFAALIPKGTYLTVCILGNNIKTNTVRDFLSLPLVKKALPEKIAYDINCSCMPKMNVCAPVKPFADRLVICGDAGCTRLFKDGLGAAYLMGKAAAKTAVFDGIGREHFSRHYHPVYKEIIKDNSYGNLLYNVIGIYRRNSILTKALLKVVEKEQGDTESRQILSTILWDMFTGNERYKNIFLNSLKVKMHMDMWEGLFKSLIRG